MGRWDFGSVGSLLQPGLWCRVSAHRRLAVGCEGGGGGALHLVPLLPAHLPRSCKATRREVLARSPGGSAVRAAVLQGAVVADVRGRGADQLQGHDRDHPGPRDHRGPGAGRGRARCGLRAGFQAEHHVHALSRRLCLTGSFCSFSWGEAVRGFSPTPFQIFSLIKKEKCGNKKSPYNCGVFCLF